MRRERRIEEDRGGSVLEKYVFVIYPLSWNQRVYVCELEEQELSTDVRYKERAAVTANRGSKESR